MPELDSPVGLANRPGKNPRLDILVRKTSLRLYEALRISTSCADTPDNQAFFQDLTNQRERGYSPAKIYALNKSKRSPSDGAAFCAFPQCF